MSMQLAGAYRTFFRPRKTIAFGTRIQSVIPPANRGKTKVTTLKYTAAGTAHTLTFLRPLGPKTKLTLAVAAGGTSYTLARDPGNYSANWLADQWPGTPLAANNLIASGDNLIVGQPIGNQWGWTQLVVSGSPTTNADGTVTLTATAAPTGGFAASADVYFMGVAADTDPRTGEAHPAYSGTASVTTTVDGNGGSVCETVGLDEPMLFDSDNSTATGVLELITGVYADK